MNPPEILYVVIEYSFRQRRVIVRGVFRDYKTPVPLLDPENQQNRVEVFAGIDMGNIPGFPGLVPEEPRT